MTSKNNSFESGLKSEIQARDIHIFFSKSKKVLNSNLTTRFPVGFNTHFVDPA